jgi:hypothetical protein
MIEARPGWQNLRGGDYGGIGVYRHERGDGDYDCHGYHCFRCPAAAKALALRNRPAPAPDSFQQGD